jgi:hypothetical protein
VFAVKPPVKKSSLGEPPREAFPTDSVTSSYGVGPTDENGRPLFGLSALRRRQSTNSNLQTPQGRQHIACQVLWEIYSFPSLLVNEVTFSKNFVCVYVVNILNSDRHIFKQPYF